MSDEPSVSTPETEPTPAAPPTVRPPSHIRATWEGDQLFATGKPDGPPAHFDGRGKAGQTPPDALLSALASCAGIDVVDYLEKRRTPVTAFAVDVEGDRRELHPRRFEKLRLRFAIEGAGVERSHAERAVRLAFERYCSVSASLAPDIEISAVVILNGEEGSLMQID